MSRRGLLRSLSRATPVAHHVQHQDQPGHEEERAAEDHLVGNHQRAGERGRGDHEAGKQAPAEAIRRDGQPGIRGLHDEPAESQVLEDLARLQRYVVSRA